MSYIFHNHVLLTQFKHKNCQITFPTTLISANVFEYDMGIQKMKTNQFKF